MSRARKWCDQCDRNVYPECGKCPTCKSSDLYIEKADGCEKPEASESFNTVEINIGGPITSIKLVGADGSVPVGDFMAAKVRLNIKATPFSPEFCGIIRDIVGSELESTALDRLSKLATLNALMGAIT